MNLQVIPVEGCGWFSLDCPAQRVELPEQFKLKLVSPAREAAPPVLIGLVEESGHLLEGLWVLLERRILGEKTAYALRAFLEDPRLISRRSVARMQAAVSGFVEVRVPLAALP